MLVGEQSPLDGLDVGTGMDHKKDQYSVEANTLPLANCHYELISAGNWFFLGAGRVSTVDQRHESVGWIKKHLLLSDYFCNRFDRYECTKGVKPGTPLQNLKIQSEFISHDESK